MIPYSIRRCERGTQFNHSPTVLHVWTLSIILYDVFPGIADKPFREHLPLYSHLNRKVIYAYVVRTSGKLALSSNSPNLMSLSYWIINWRLHMRLSLIVYGRLGWIYLNIDQRKFALPIQLCRVVERLIVVFDVNIVRFFKPLSWGAYGLVKVRCCNFLIHFRNLDIIDLETRWNLWLVHLEPEVIVGSFASSKRWRLSRHQRLLLN